MGINRCVTCGVIIPEGDHICKQCKEGTNTIMYNSVGRIEIEPVILSFYNFDVEIENSVSLLETLFKYYIFTTNMDFEGQFDFHFVNENIMPGESVGDASNRLCTEYIDVVNTIESLIIKK